MGIKEDLEEIKRLISQEDKKEKKFRIPFGKKVSTGQKKKNYVTLIILGDNNHLDFKKVAIEDQSFIHDRIPRLAGAGYVFYYKKNPFIIIPQWSVEPLTNPSGERTPLKAFNSKEDYEESLRDGRNTVGYRILLAKMENSAINQKKGLPGIMKWIIGLGLLAIVVYAFATGGI